MKLTKLFLAFVLSVFLLMGCGPKLITKQEAYPKVYEQRPLAILVLPPINETTAADAKEYYATTVAEPLSLTGYYVYPMEVITEVLRHEGVYETDTLLNLKAQKFKEFFGADAVMYIWINKWNTSYYVVGGNVTVGVRSLLRSTTTGEDIWQYEGTIVYDTTARSSGGGLIGLAVAAVVTAIKTAATDYVPVARQANYIVLSTIPSGKYHPNHDKDRNQEIVPGGGVIRTQ